MRFPSNLVCESLVAYRLRIYINVDIFYSYYSFLSFYCYFYTTFKTVTLLFFMLIAFIFGLWVYYSIYRLRIYIKVNIFFTLPYFTLYLNYAVDIYFFGFFLINNWFYILFFWLNPIWPGVCEHLFGPGGGCFSPPPTFLASGHF